MSATPAGAEGSTRAHLKKYAKQGNPTAMRALEGPPFPETLDYLWSLALQLHGRCGATAGGLLPLNHQEIKAFRDNMRVDLDPHEVDALIQLDGALLHPEEPEEAD